MPKELKGSLIGLRYFGTSAKKAESSLSFLARLCALSQVTVYALRLLDARTYTVGEVFQSAPGSGGVQYTNVTVLLPSYRFEDDCKLIGWRICTETSGYVSLQVGIYHPIRAKHNIKGGISNWPMRC